MLKTCFFATADVSEDLLSSFFDEFPVEQPAKTKPQTARLLHILSG